MITINSGQNRKSAFREQSKADKHFKKVTGKMEIALTKFSFEQNELE